MNFLLFSCLFFRETKAHKLFFSSILVLNAIWSHHRRHWFWSQTLKIILFYFPFFFFIFFSTKFLSFFDFSLTTSSREGTRHRNVNALKKILLALETIFCLFFLFVLPQEPFTEREKRKANFSSLNSGQGTFHTFPSWLLPDLLFFTACLLACLSTYKHSTHFILSKFNQPTTKWVKALFSFMLLLLNLFFFYFFIFVLDVSFVSFSFLLLLLCCAEKIKWYYNFQPGERRRKREKSNNPNSFSGGVVGWGEKVWGPAE